ncbi:MAG: alanine racemase [Candidatus Thorarchaeota archaeon]
MIIEKPTLIIKKEQVISNIKKMIEKAEKSDVQFRPHFKTHQSAEIGNWFKDLGVNTITVSSVEMAEYFAKNGWNNILIAFTVNILQIDRINKLAKKVQLGLLIDSEETLDFLLKNIQEPVTVWLKIDTAYHRTGIIWDNEPIISKLIRSIKKSERLKFGGLLTHSGHTYKTKSKTEIEEIYEDTISKLLNIKERLMLQGFGLVKISIGDTPTCSIINDFTGIHDIRPGNFVFYDLTQLHLGSCMEDEISVALACPVVAKYPERNEFVIYGGAIHLSKDNLKLENDVVSYGAIALPEGKYWGKILNNVYVKSLSQEHGIIKADKKFIEKLTIGDLVYIIPVHSCLTADLMKEYYTSDGLRITMMAPFCEKREG